MNVLILRKFLNRLFDWVRSGDENLNVKIIWIFFFVWFGCFFEFNFRRIFYNILFV